MGALFPVMVLCLTGGTVEQEQLVEFKAHISWPRGVMMWLQQKANRDAIDVTPAQFKDLNAVMLKHIEQIRKIEKETREKFPFPQDPATGQIIGIEASKAHDRYLKAVAKVSASVRVAWRKDIRKILSRAQIVKMNEIKWQAGGARCLFSEEFQRILGLEEEQREQLKQIYRWSVTAPPNLVAGMPGDSEPVMVAKRKEAHEKALAVLTPEQLKAFKFLLGGK